eukprot:UN01825
MTGGNVSKYLTLRNGTMLPNFVRRDIIGLLDALETGAMGGVIAGDRGIAQDVAKNIVQLVKQRQEEETGISNK